VGDFHEKYLRFGLVLGWLAILKKKVWADYEQLSRAVFFSCFQGQTFFLMFLKIYCSLRTKEVEELLEVKVLWGDCMFIPADWGS
jgi:hypothetical protein